MDQAGRHLIDDLISTLRAGLPAVLTEIDPEVKHPAADGYLRWGRPSHGKLPAIEVSTTSIPIEQVDPNLRHAYATSELLVVVHYRHHEYDGMMDALDVYGQAIITTIARAGDGAAGPFTRLMRARLEYRADPWFRDTNDAPSKAMLASLTFMHDVDLPGL